MNDDLYVLDGDVVRREPDAAAWADWMENTDRVVEMAEGHTPKGRWQLLTFFFGMEMTKPEGEFFFATQFARGDDRDAMKVTKVELAEDMQKALANHTAMLNELRPSSDDVSA